MSTDCQITDIEDSPERYTCRLNLDLASTKGSCGSHRDRRSVQEGVYRRTVSASKKQRGDKLEKAVLSH